MKNGKIRRVLDDFDLNVQTYFIDLLYCDAQTVTSLSSPTLDAFILADIREGIYLASDPSTLPPYASFAPCQHGIPISNTPFILFFHSFPRVNA